MAKCQICFALALLAVFKWYDTWTSSTLVRIVTVQKQRDQKMMLHKMPQALLVLNHVQSAIRFPLLSIVLINHGSEGCRFPISAQMTCWEFIRNAWEKSETAGVETVWGCFISNAKVWWLEQYKVQLINQLQHQQQIHILNVHSLAHSVTPKNFSMQIIWAPE